jgi:predicted regulator of Ras-like GTPase activity (Roadblock/LC7/MglB family)
MAELLLKQGQTGRALAIYRKLARQRPDDLQTVRRLREVEAHHQRGADMSFHEEIQRIVDNVPGALAGVIMGFDGIAIDTYEKAPGQIDVTTLLTEYSSAAEQMRRAAESLAQPGAVTEVAVAAENLTTVMRPLTSEVFLGIILGPGGLTGKARYMMRVAGPVIAKELS